MSLARTNNSIKGQGSGVSTYEQFSGLDTSRDVVSLDTGKQQHLTKLNNGFCDWRGQIVRDPPVIAANPTDGPVRHIRFYRPGSYVFASDPGSGKLDLHSSNDHSFIDAYTDQAVVASTVYNRKAFLCSRNEPVYTYDGAIFRAPENPLNLQYRPAYMTSVGRRLAIAGILQTPTRVEFSRVDTEDFWHINEPADSENVLRGGYLDIGNELNTGDAITGLSQFEQNRLLIFSNDRTFLYKIDQSIDDWTIDERANIHIGCLSHNTICRAGGDVIFCSRSGIQTVQRSADNGILVYSKPLSQKIDILYRHLLRQVSDYSQISAVFDQDEAQYHVFFPSASGVFSQRLSLSINPEVPDTYPTWSTGDFLRPRCGDFLAGKLIMGGALGAYEVLKIEDTTGDHPSLDFSTPYFWHGSITDNKASRQLILQAYGSGSITIVAEDDQGRILQSFQIELEGGEDDKDYNDVPLFQEYQRLFQHKYRGVRFHFCCEGKGMFRFFGLAVAYTRE